MLIKSALRDLLSVSYGMISILVISRYAAPPYPAAPSTLTPIRACQPSGIQLPADSAQKPMVSLTPKAVKKWRRRRRTSPAQRYYITPEGGALKPPVRRSRSQAEPWQPRAERPGGWLNPHARKGVSTFGNTGKYRPRSRPRHRRPLSPSEPGPPSGPIRISLFF